MSALGPPTGRPAKKIEDIHSRLCSSKLYDPMGKVKLFKRQSNLLAAARKSAGEDARKSVFLHTKNDKKLAPDL